MDQYEYIRTAHRVYGKSVRLIARETGHDRKTIRRVLRGEMSGYPKRAYQPYPVLGPYLRLIDDWLEGDRAVSAKQRHTATRIYQRLVSEEGFTGSESAVRQYVRLAKIRLGVGSPRAFIPLDPDCGKEAEVDWGCAQAVIGGEEQRVKFFCMRSKYSGKHFVCCYPCERQQAFFDGHLRAFAFFGGVFETLVYDNLSAAVRKVLQGKGRIEQESFRAFRAYYSFESRFCNLSAGHEKGGVEGLVGYARRNYMVPVPRAENLEELNERLLRSCVAFGSRRIAGREKTVEELFEEEKAHLIALPASPFANTVISRARVSPYSTVLLDRNRYSVPVRYAGLWVSASLGVDSIELFHEGKSLARHPRVFGDGKWQLDADHYLDLLRQRPAAFSSARPIRQWRRVWPDCLERLLCRFREKQGEMEGTKDFVSVLMLYRSHTPEEIESAVEQALEARASSSEAVLHLLLPGQGAYGAERLRGWPATEPADVSVYGSLGGLR